MLAEPKLRCGQLQRILDLLLGLFAEIKASDNLLFKYAQPADGLQCEVLAFIVGKFIVGKTLLWMPSCVLANMHFHTPLTDVLTNVLGSQTQTDREARSANGCGIAQAIRKLQSTHEGFVHGILLIARAQRSEQHVTHVIEPSIQIKHRIVVQTRRWDWNPLAQRNDGAYTRCEMRNRITIRHVCRSFALWVTYKLVRQLIGVNYEKSYEKPHKTK
jgi:hypothetical protein